MQFAEEKITHPFLNEVEGLFDAHAEEAEVVDAPVSPDRLTYIAASDRGDVATFTIRHEGKIIGYATYFVHTHQQFEKEVARMDLLFIHKDYRRGLMAIRFLKFCEESLKNDYNVEVIVQHSTAKKPIGKLFEFLGYEEAGTIYMRIV